MSETPDQKLGKRLQYVRGLPIPHVPWFPKKAVEEAFDYVPHDGDIVIASYPKTGTTWLQYIVQQIVTKGQHFPEFYEMLLQVSPFIEMAGADAVDAMTENRMYKHHLPYNMVPKNDKAKYLYIYRNPEDCFVSYYHFMLSLIDEPLSFDEFFEDFITGKVGYGRYFEHVLSYLSHENPESLLLISYEKLQANRREELLRIAKFLGESYYQELSNDESALNRVMEHTSFDYMKKNLTLEHPMNKKSESSERQNVNFFRKGIVGDGKNYLSNDQQRKLRELVVELMNGTRIADEWLNEN